MKAKAKAERDEQAAKDADTAAKALVEKNAAAEAAAKVSRDAATADTQESSPQETDVLTLRQALMKDVNADESTEAAGETETDKCGEIINVAHKCVLCRDPTTWEVADYRGMSTKTGHANNEGAQPAPPGDARVLVEYAAKKATLVASASRSWATK